MTRFLKTPPEPRPGSYIKYTPKPCVLNRHTFPHLDSKFNNYAVYTHNGCSCNQYLALRFRHQVKSPVCADLDPGLVKLFHTMDPKINLNHTKLTPWTKTDVVRSYAGKWRQKYARAHEQVKISPVTHKHSYVTLFVKDDKEMRPCTKPPRAIQYRHPCFMLEMGKYTKAVEKWFYSLKDEYGTKIVGKLSGPEVAAELKKKSDSFANPVYLCLDASNFDTCVDEKWLKHCMNLYLECFDKVYHRRIKWLWAKTLTNTGFTKNGTIKYKTKGTRMSGDMDTGLGNSIIMYTMLTSYLKQHNVKGSIMVNGDDSVVVIEARHLQKCKDLSIFKSFGFNMKFDVKYEFEDVEFCQCKPVNTYYGWTMARRPDRIIGRTGVRTRYVAKTKIKSFVSTLGMCERASGWGVPIISEMATKMINLGGKISPSQLNPYMVTQYKYLKYPPIVSMEARLSYERAWGVSVQDQLRLESDSSFKEFVRLTTRMKDAFFMLTELQIPNTSTNGVLVG
nr:RNA-dependent RNA polymerase [Tolivirales sp.]